MKKYKFLVFAPYKGLKEVAKDVKRDFENIEIEVIVSNLTNKERIIERVLKDDFDAIIIRGGVWEFVKTISSKPAIEIEITPFEMIRVVRLLEWHTGKIVIAAYSNIVNRVKTIKELLGNNIDIYEMQRYDYEMTEACVDDMVSKGYSMIVGDTGIWEWAQKKGISSILITNGTESMHDAYKKAIEVCEYKYKEREKNGLLSF